MAAASIADLCDFSGQLYRRMFWRSATSWQGAIFTPGLLGVGHEAFLRAEIEFAHPADGVTPESLLQSPQNSESPEYEALLVLAYLFARGVSRAMTTAENEEKERHLQHGVAALTLHLMPARKS